MYTLLQSPLAAAHYFGLARLEIGVTTHTDMETRQTQQVGIKSCWMMTQNTVGSGYVTVACVNTTHGKWGIMLIPPMAEKLRENLDEPLRSLKPIDLNGWDDVVQNALQQINLFPLEPTNYIRETHFSVPWSFIIQFTTAICSGGFHIDRYSPKTPSLVNLGYSIHQAIAHYGSKYKDNEAVYSYLAAHDLLND